MIASNVAKFRKIGGTLISAIVGQNPWETPHGAYLRLRREVDDTPDNEAMARGRRFEPIVAEIFQGGRPEYRVEHNRQGTDAPEIYEHEQYNYLVGHPDRMLFDSKSNDLVGGLEIKTSNWSNLRKWGSEGTDEIPANYLIQCQWYAGLANLPFWRVAVAFLDDSGVMKQYKEFNINADRELYETLVERAVEFWERHVVPGIPPEIDVVDETTSRWITKRFPKNVEPMEKANDDEEQIIADFIAKKRELDSITKVYEQAEMRLKMAIGDRDGLESETLGKVTWKRSKDSQRVDYRGICGELNPPEELVAKYTKPVEGTRRFITSGLKTND